VAREAVWQATPYEQRSLLLSWVSKHLEAILGALRASQDPFPNPDLTKEFSHRRFIRRLTEDVVTSVGGNITEASRYLGVTPKTVRKWLRW